MTERGLPSLDGPVLLTLPHFRKHSPPCSALRIRYPQVCSVATEACAKLPRMCANWRKAWHLFFARCVASLCRLFSNNPHRHASHSANDFRLRRVVKPPHLQSGIGVRNDEQLSSVNLAPATYVSIPQLREIDWPLVLVLPRHVADLSLARINLHKRARANDWKQREILKPNIAIHRFS